ncbi:MAG: outer membrane beta-barrel domain-containing protein [Pseudomonadota bacterium]|nr:outer membrane beta-barrel domain-containing protein [Pseudomonadota bacterium]
MSVVLGLVGLLGAAPEALAADHPAETALEEMTGKKLPPNLIQNRFFVKANRFEIAPSIGYVPNNAFVTSIYGGAIAAYHFSDTFAAEGAFLYAPNTGASGMKGLTQTLVGIAYEGNNDTTFRQPLDRLQLGAIFSARWAPVYGKINLIGEGVLNFDLYGTAGVGLMLVTKDYASINPDYASNVEGADPAIPTQSPATEAYPAINLGIGLDFFLTQSIALKIDARSAFYIADQPDYGNKLPNGQPEPLEKRLYNTFLTTAGVSIYIPRMKPRLFNF